MKPGSRSRLSTSRAAFGDGNNAIPRRGERLLDGLGASSGTPLDWVPDSVLRSTETASTTGRGARLWSPALTEHFLAHILLSSSGANSSRLWAWVFLFVGGRRVAPAALSHLEFTFDKRYVGWVRRGWEADVYGE